MDIADGLASVGIKHAASEFLWGNLKELLRATITWPETEQWDYPRFQKDVDKIKNEEPYKIVIDKIEQIEEPSHFQIDSSSLRQFINNVYPYNGNIFAELAGLWHKDTYTICTFLLENGCKMQEIIELREASLSQQTLEEYCFEHCSWYWFGD